MHLQGAASEYSNAAQNIITVLPDMDRILELATKWNIDTEHYDGLGRHWRVEPAVLEQILEAIGVDHATPQSFTGTSVAAGFSRAFQGNETLPQRSWGIAVQLYGIRSHRNWGHGGF